MWGNRECSEMSEKTLNYFFVSSWGSVGILVEKAKGVII